MEGSVSGHIEETLKKLGCVNVDKVVLSGGHFIAECQECPVTKEPCFKPGTVCDPNNCSV